MIRGIHLKQDPPNCHPLTHFEAYFGPQSLSIASVTFGVLSFLWEVREKELRINSTPKIEKFFQKEAHLACQH